MQAPGKNWQKGKDHPQAGVEHDAIKCENQNLSFYRDFYDHLVPEVSMKYPPIIH